MVWRRKSRVWYSTLSPGTVRYGTVWYHDEGTSFVAKQETFRDSMNSLSVSRAEVNTRPLTPPPPRPEGSVHLSATGPKVWGRSVAAIGTVWYRK